MDSSHEDNINGCENSLDNLEKTVGPRIFENNILIECDSELALAESALHDATNKSVEKNSFALTLEVSNDLFNDLLTSKIVPGSHPAENETSHELQEEDNISEDFNYLLNPFDANSTRQNHDLDKETSGCKEDEAMLITPCEKSSNSGNDTIEIFDDEIEDTINEFSSGQNTFEDISDITIIEISDNDAEDINDTLVNSESFDRETKKLHSPNTIVYEKENNFGDKEARDDPLNSPNTTITNKDEENNLNSPVKLSNDDLSNRETKKLYSSNTIVSQKDKHFCDEPKNLNFPLKLNKSLLSDISDSSFCVTKTMHENSPLNKEILVSDRNYSMKPNETNPVKPETIVATAKNINTETQYSSIDLKNKIHNINAKATIVSEKGIKPQLIETIVSNRNEKPTCNKTVQLPNNKREIPQSSEHNKKQKITTSSTRIIKINNKPIPENNVSHNTSEINYTKAIFDPDETADYNDPKWSVLKDLRTTEDYFNSVRTQWRSQTLPNPHTDLTKRYMAKSSIKPLPSESTEQDRVVSCTQYLHQRLTTLYQTRRNLNLKLNIQSRTGVRRQLSKLTNEIERLNAEIHRIEKNQVEIKQINKYYTESANGWDAKYLTSNQMKEVEMQDTIFDFQKNFYQK